MVRSALKFALRPCRIGTVHVLLTVIGLVHKSVRGDTRARRLPLNLTELVSHHERDRYGNTERNQTGSRR